jgi:DNA-binding transcriptional regulator YbjK
MRGLTHRAVDEAAGLPAGSTSNVVRTRAALLELTLDRLSALPEAHLADAGLGGAPARTSPEALVELVVTTTHRQLTTDRTRLLARYELALEATRRPELRRRYDAGGRRFRELATEVMERLGSSDPARHGGLLVAFLEGVSFDAVAGAGATPTRDELRSAVTDFLTGALRRPPADRTRRA